MSYDTVVVGAGLAGLTAALRLSELGLRVLVVARGIGATHLAPATIDVLGYAGIERADRPSTAMPGLLEAAPEHPYSHLSDDQLQSSLEWFTLHTTALGYGGSLDENLLLPTAMGVAKPSTLAPASMLDGDLRAGGRFVFVGFRGFKDFYPTLIADNLGRARLSIPVAARALEVEPPPMQRSDIGGRVLAEHFDTHQITDWLASSLEHRVAPDERVGLPAVLGLRRSGEIWQELRSNWQRPVFEVSTPPPSIPGMRLFETLTAALRSAGVRLVIGATVVGAHARDGRIEAVDVAGGARVTRYPIGSVVLASGGFAGGGLELDSFGATRDTVFDLPLVGVPDTGRVRFAPHYFDAQPLSAAGVGVDEVLRPINRDGSPVYANLHAAGAILGGAVPWKEHSGTGISVATGYAAAEAIGATRSASTAGAAR